MDTRKLNQLLKLYPTMKSQKLADELEVSLSVVNKTAQRYKLKKSKAHLEQLVLERIENRRKWFNNQLVKFEPTFEQEQIIFGSMLGDGYVSKGSKRSIHYHYQEHFGENQLAYRQWKLKKLENLNFSIRGNYLRSKSNTYFNHLHSLLYDKNGKKVLTELFLTKCTGISFLLSLYLDDGSLTMSKRYNHNTKRLYFSPSVVLYTLNFTKNENERLKNHLNETFGTSFVVSGHPDGQQSLLKLNKVSDIEFFLNCLHPYINEIPSMRYKMCIASKIDSLKKLLPEHVVNNYAIVTSNSERTRPYSIDEINLLVSLKTTGKTDKVIAEVVNRSYWSVVYKLKDLRLQGKLK